jgi:hypothetical protein
MSNGKPILTELNNGITKATNGMPLKDLTTDYQSSFEMNRTLFTKSYVAKPNFRSMTLGKSIIQRNAAGIQHSAVIDGPKTVLQKKWIGGNRDASSIVANRRKNTVGQIMNFPGPRSFVNVSDNTTRINALARVRGGGAHVPMKVTHKNVKSSMFNVFTR